MLDGEEEQYRLNEKGKDLCIKLLSGATPSELGMDFAQAFMLLASLSSSSANALEDKGNELNPEFKQRLIEFRKQVMDLAKMFKDAAIASGEFPDE